MSLPSALVLKTVSRLLSEEEEEEDLTPLENEPSGEEAGEEEDVQPENFPLSPYETGLLNKYRDLATKMAHAAFRRIKGKERDVTVDDMQSVAQLALLRAVRRYDPDKDFNNNPEHFFARVIHNRMEDMVRSHQLYRSHQANIIDEPLEYGDGRDRQETREFSDTEGNAKRKEKERTDDVHQLLSFLISYMEDPLMRELATEYLENGKTDVEAFSERHDIPPRRVYFLLQRIKERLRDDLADLGKKSLRDVVGEAEQHLPYPEGSEDVDAQLRRLIGSILPEDAWKMLKILAQRRNRK